ncbi:TolC family protein [Maribellus sp. CM-23]|uniref:TolC family protein n=1 Tax=Maribellus sp. CM-23 TaxID=2781026 RepID=UPI001F3407FB|nr:TolC family protein [Maribellus sp. CM-23]MCE4566563.1 TolC family protein [Maribellus sp. CM-23]
MKRLIIYVLATIVMAVDAGAQTSIDQVLREVEQNNTTLVALKRRVDAETAGNKTDLFLPNPEVEFNYLFGSPSSIGNRTDISITQGFDFPTVYSRRSDISNLRNEQVLLEYKRQQKELFLHTRQVCNQLIYLNSMLKEYAERIENARRMVDLFQAKFETGEANVLDYNKARLALLDLNKKAEALQVIREEQLAELTRLNGGKEIDLQLAEFPAIIIPDDFESWYAQAEQNNPVLAWLKLETEVSRQNEKLNSALSLPKFQAGYMSEKVVGERFQGISVGVSVPLWESKNKVKEARALTEVSRAVEQDNQLRFYNSLKALHAKGLQLQSSLSDYQQELELCNNTTLAAKALEAGEISMIDYIMELTVYYESFNNMIEIQKDLHQTQAELMQYEE